MLTALNASPDLLSRPRLRELAGPVAGPGRRTVNNGTLSSLADLARNLQSTQEMQTVDLTLSRLQESLNQAVAAVRSTNGLQSRIAQMQQGANALADGSRAVGRWCAGTRRSDQDRWASASTRRRRSCWG